MIKKMIYVFALSLLVTGAVAQSKDSVAVAAAVENLRKGMIDPEKGALEKITSTKLSYGHSSGHVEDQESFITNLTNGKSDFVTIDLTNQRIMVQGGTAVVRHDLSATTNDGGKPGTVNLHVMTVWVKEKGAWKMLARQAVKLAH